MFSYPVVVVVVDDTLPYEVLLRSARAFRTNEWDPLFNIHHPSRELSASVAEDSFGSCPAGQRVRAVAARTVPLPTPYRWHPMLQLSFILGPGVLVTRIMSRDLPTKKKM